MAKNAAGEGTLGLMHSLLATKISGKLAEEDCDPRWAQIAVKFLNDNNIYQIKEIGNEMDELEKDLTKRKRRFNTENITDLATELAKKEAMG
jgi:hypothetical protein